MGNCQDNPNSLSTLDDEEAQSHLMNHWKNLPSSDKRRTFEQQLNRVNVNQVLRIYKKSSRSSTSRSTSLASSTESERTSGVVDYRPLAQGAVVGRETIMKEKEQLDRIGKLAIKNGEVAVLIMAGSHNPQLNLEMPLGIYDIGLDSACTIFQILFARLLRLNILSEATEQKRIKVYIMGSSENKDLIKKYFVDRKYFAYGAGNVFFFSQPVEPVVDEHGKIVLKTEDTIYMSPRGTGAIYSQIKQKNLTHHLETQGIKYLHICPANNLLLKIADPCTLGYLIKNNLEIAAPCLKAKDDCFGYFGLDGLDKDVVKVYEERLPNSGKKWANSGACFMTVEFLRSVVGNPDFLMRMQENYHDVVRLATVFNTSLNTKITQKCLFFENYYHEAFSLAKRIALIEIDPEGEFAPIISGGNAKYSLNHAKQTLWKWHKKLVSDAGVSVTGQGQLEIHPALTYEGQNLAHVLKQKKIGPQIKVPAIIR